MNDKNEVERAVEKAAADYADKQFVLYTESMEREWQKVADAYVAGYLMAKELFSTAWDDGFEAGKRFYTTMLDESN